MKTFQLLKNGSVFNHVKKKLDISHLYHDQYWSTLLSCKWHGKSLWIHDEFWNWTIFWPLDWYILPSKFRSSLWNFDFQLHFLYFVRNQHWLMWTEATFFCFLISFWSKSLDGFTFNSFSASSHTFIKTLFKVSVNPNSALLNVNGGHLFLFLNFFLVQKPR